MGILFQATRIFRSPEGVSLRPVKRWLAVTLRRSSQTTGALAGCIKQQISVFILRANVADVNYSIKSLNRLISPLYGE
ncbi:hypothetical protein EHW66_19180 [Erwinia psidii]|nr:hypothetical protein [Erwinia psidii]MCX8967021.1 hypothetical protein [Erwinia psidii]